MSETELDTRVYRAKLDEERARLVNAYDFLVRENPGSLEDELGDIAAGNDNHLGDMASAMYERELDVSLEEGVQQTLDDIDLALKKIEEGTYGVCEVCGKPIGAGRLNAIPWARFCIDDQRRQDG